MEVTHFPSQGQTFRKKVFHRENLERNQLLSILPFCFTYTTCLNWSSGDKMEIYHHYVANPRELLLLFPKIVTGHCIGLRAIPEDTAVLLPTQHLQVQGTSIFPMRNNVKIRTSIYTDLCNHNGIFLTLYSYTSNWDDSPKDWSERSNVGRDEKNPSWFLCVSSFPSVKDGYQNSQAISHCCQGLCKDKIIAYIVGHLNVTWSAYFGVGWG